MAEEFDIRFSETGAKQVVQSMREMNAAATEAAQRSEDLQDSLARVRTKADPAASAYNQLAKNLDILNRSQKANLITGAQQERMSASLIKSAEGQLRPFSSLISNIQSETRAWTQNSTARQASIRTTQQQQALQSRGIALNAEESATLERTNLVYVQTREAAIAAEQAERARAAAVITASRQAEAAVQREAAARVRRDAAVAGVSGRNNAENAALGLGSTARNAELRSISQIDALRKNGIALTDEETQSIRSQNQIYAEQRDQISQLNRLKRQLAQVSQIGGNPVAEARNRFASARSVVSQAGAAGLITVERQAALEKQLATAFAEQTDPLVRSNRLLAERAEYQTGLFNSGRALAQVERDIARARELGVVGSTAEITSLRNQARAVDAVEKSYSRLNSIKGLFSSTLGGIGLLFGGEALVHSFDAIQNIQNLLSVTSTGVGNQAAVTDQVFQVSRDTHSEVEDTAKLYGRINIAVKQYGYSQQEILNLTKELNQQIRLSGTSQGESTRAVLDFVHTISAGVVQYRSLRQLITQAPFTILELDKGLTKLLKTDSQFKARAAGAGVNVAKDIGVGDLEKLTSKRALSSGNVATALKSEAEDTAKAFQKLTPTISQAFTDVHTEFLKFLTDFNSSTSASANLARGVDFIADNLKTIIPLLAITGSLMFGLFVRNLIKESAETVAVFAKNISFTKTATTEASVATDINTGAIEANDTQLATQTGLLAANRREFDLSTASISRNAGIRSTASLSGGAGAARSLTAGELSTANAGLAAGAGRLGVQQLRGVGQTANAAAGLAGEATAATGIGAAFTSATRAAGGFFGTMRSGAGLIGGALSGVIGGLAEAIPLVFALGAAWLLLKDNISVATNQTLLYSDNGTEKAIKGTVTLGDVANGVFQSIASGQDNLTQHQVDSAGVQTDAQKKALDEQNTAAVNSFNKTQSAFDQLHDGILKSTISLVAQFESGAANLSKIWGDTVDVMVEIGTIAFRVLKNEIIDLFNNTSVPIANFAKGFGIGSGATPFAREDVSAPVIFKDGRTAAQRAELRQQHNDAVSATARERLSRLVLGSAANRIGDGRTVTSGDGGNEPFDPSKKHKKHRDPLEKAYEELTKATVPLIEAIHKFNEQMDTLKKAFEKGLVQKLADEINAYDKAHPGANIANTTTGQISASALRDRQAAVLQRELEDKLDPTRVFERNNQEKISQLGGQGASIGNLTNASKFQLDIDRKVTQEVKNEEKAEGILAGTLNKLAVARIRASITAVDEAELIAKTNDALRASADEHTRQISQLGETKELIEAQNQAYSVLKDALQSNDPLLKAQAESQYTGLVKTNLAQIAYVENVEKTRDLYQSIIAPATQYRDTVVSLNNLLNAGAISLDKYNQLLRDGTAKALEANRDGLSGLESALIDIKDKTSNTAADMKSVFEDAYNNIESGFQDLFTGGDPLKSLQKVLGGITGDLSKALFHKFTDPLISKIAGPKGLNIPGFGDKAIQANRVDLNATTVYVGGQGAVSAAGQAPAYASPANTPFNNSTGVAANDNSLTNLGVSNYNPAGALLSGNGTLTGQTPFGFNDTNPGLASGENFLSQSVSGISNLFGSTVSAGGNLLNSVGSALPGPLGAALGIGGSVFGLGGARGGAAPVPVTIVGGGASGDATGLSSLFGGGRGGGNPLTNLFRSLFKPAGGSAAAAGGGSGGFGLSSLLGSDGGGGFSSLLGGLGGGGGGGGGFGLSSLLGGLGGGGGGGLGSLLGGLGGGGGGLGSLLGGLGGAAGGGSFLSSILSFAPLFGFATGGAFTVAGHGGTDSKVVAFKATPGENVEVKTPGQQKAGQHGPGATVNQKIVNVIDPGMALDAMRTEQGFSVVLNHIQSNPQAVKRALAAG